MSEGLEVDKVSALVIQLLFGRYNVREKTTKPIHIVVICIVLVVVVLLYVYLLRKRFRTHATKLQEIGVGQLLMDEGSRGYNAMLNQCVNAYQLNRNIHPRVRDNRDGALEQMAMAMGVVTGDPGAMVEEQADKRNAPSPPEQAAEDGFVVNFNRSVADSYKALEMIIKRRRPNLLHRHDRTIRDYVSNSVHKAFPKLSTELCEHYINTYERAVFGPEKLKAPEFQEFQQVLAGIQQMINVNRNPLEEVQDDRPSASLSKW